MVEEHGRRLAPVVRFLMMVTNSGGNSPDEASIAKSKRKYQFSVLVLTFLAYAAYHASRKPSSIVKSVLDPQSIKASANPANSSSSGLLWVLPGHGDSANSGLWVVKKLGILGAAEQSSGWAPFNGTYGTSLLGEIDVAFLAAYSVGMYFAGHLGDCLDLRMFLAAGMIGSGTMVALFGTGYWWNIHCMGYFLVVQVVAGLFQATGWPSVVAVMGNWFGKGKRGLIMGLWNAHTSVGNILGSVVAASVLKYGWGWSYLVPGAVLAFMGIVIFLLLVVAPEDVGIFPVPDSPCSAGDLEKGGFKGQKQSSEVSDNNGDLEAPLLQSVHHSSSTSSVSGESSASSSGSSEAIGFMGAWRIPGVATYALCLFFAKLVAYTFLYWLPFYVSHTAINGSYLSDETAGNLSTLFDVGGVLGGIVAGHISDKLEARAITAASFMYCSIPVLILYRIYGGLSMNVNIVLLMLAGVFVNGPYALITTAVCADLGTHSSLKGNSRALATVTAIIDGTGSVGAALGPFLTGFISTRGWNGVFTMLMVAAFVAGLLLTRLVIAEVMAKVNRAKQLRNPAGSVPEHP